MEASGKFFAFLILLLLLPVARASPEKVDVGLYLLDISKYDIRTGEFTADFYLDFKCSENCSPEGFEFMNGRATTSDLAINNSNEKFYRIQGTFGSRVNMTNYPFDMQTVQIILEDKLKTKDQLIYLALANESGMDDHKNFPGWEIKNWTVAVDGHYYPPYDETYSRYTFSIDIERVILSALLKTFVPLFFIILIALASMFLSPNEMGFRITIGGSTLVTTVLLHLNMLSEIPPTPYLTFTDKFMFANYSILLLCFLVNIAVQELKMRGRKKEVETVQRYTELSVLLVPFVYVLLFYLLL